MALSEDQRALLRLLAQREEGYDDIAALMGVSVDEVRARVKGALEELRREEPAADPVHQGSAAVGPIAAGDPSPPAVAKASSGAVPPAAPPAEETPQPRRARAADRAKPRRRAALQKDRRRLWELAGGALVALLLILFATGAVDIGGDSDSDSNPGAPAGATDVVAGSGKITQATLEPVDGGEASGRALFGRLGKKVVLQVVADGLEPTAAGESYTVWLYRSPKLSLRIGAVRVGEEGQLGARFEIPAEVLALVANGAFAEIDVSRTSDAAYQAQVKEARRQQRLPRYTGESVLRGEIVGPLAS